MLELSDQLNDAKFHLKNALNRSVIARIQGGDIIKARLDVGYWAERVQEIEEEMNVRTK